MHTLASSLEPLYVISGALVGLLVGFTGVGGGSLMTPLLILVFGVSPAGAVGTDLIYAAATKSVGSAVHGFSRSIDWKVVGRLALGSVPFSALTTLVLLTAGIDKKSTQHVITNALSLALLLTAFSLIFRDAVTRLAARYNIAPSPGSAAWLTVLTGMILGVLVTLSSVGAGAIGVTALVLLYPTMPARRIVGTDVAHAVPLTLVAGIGHSILGTINWHILVSLLCGSVPAIIAGSIAAYRVPDTILRAALAGVLLLVCARFWFLN